ncbi:cytochrome oxidase complex assembly protein 1-domain-containing protein [Sphaerosporella brunnea]|uniref:Cytochrome oxidase complex assembly protein 1-domain-containing protein n=1 Tax=Sphaerosporella brunnea TaxID=1250544 RepID=A0A5J5F1A2_9PEZI|nr:cytochrome oxidase complex assembly protein 1-domain-containing protein [Sphaerosporella brunnea]
MLSQSRILRPTALRTPLLRAAIRRNSTVVVHPRTGGNPVITRRPDRPLPDIETSRRLRMLTLPLFLATVTAAALAIFNYQKSSSSVVASTLYSLRVHPVAREVLGDKIQFRSRIPVIWGTLDQLHGNIDIRFAVKGTKGEGMMRFRSTRKGRMGLFDTEEWSLTLNDGRQIVLLENAKSLPKSDQN